MCAIIKFGKSGLLMMILLLSTCLFCQQKEESDFIGQIGNYDLSVLFTDDSISSEAEEVPGVIFKRPEILGFVGDDYQRFFIHFISVIQNRDDPYSYFVYCKTKLNENVLSFQGVMKVKETEKYEISEIPGFYGGSVIFDVILYSRPDLPGSGIIRGTMESYFLIESSGKLKYEYVTLGADGYSNNQFAGTLTDYKTGNSVKCHWGEFRIPDSGNLDSGDGEFSVSDAYLNNGWKTYRLGNDSDVHTEEAEKAREYEHSEWWK